MKLKLLISYTGTQYAGWQVQEKSHTLMPTIQGEVEKSLSLLFHQDIRITGASRTDSGVHADEQVAHCTIPFYPNNIAWLQALNNNLPEDIRIKDVQLVDDSFHAQYKSIGKIYTYTLWTNRNYISPRLTPFAWSCGKLNFEKIEQCIQYLIGTHDFKSFQNIGTEIQSTVRTIYAIDVVHSNEYQCDIIVSGDGFLKQMVRNIIGLLVYVGKEKISPLEAKSLLEAKFRNSIFPTAPAKGLTLTKVLYEATEHITSH